MSDNIIIFFEKSLVPNKKKQKGKKDLFFRGNAQPRQAKLLFVLLKKKKNCYLLKGFFVFVVNFNNFFINNKLTKINLLPTLKST